MSTLIIRFGASNDLPAIVDIYNQAIRSQKATGDLIEFNAKDRKLWFQTFDNNNFPIYVAEKDGSVVGYATLSAYRPGRDAFNSVAEISFFIDYKLHKIGIGTSLVQHVINDCHRINKKTLLAILLDINSESISLLQKFNFQMWGHLPDIADMNGKQCGQYLYGLKIEN